MGMRLTIDEARALTTRIAPKTPKYRNVKTTVDGITFDSKKEAQRYRELLLMARANRIQELKRQVPFSLRCPSSDGLQLEVCVYKADFTYLEDGQLVVEDVKSAGSKKYDTYALKKKWLRLQEGIEIREV